MSEAQSTTDVSFADEKFWPSFFSTDVSVERQLMAAISESMFEQKHYPREYCTLCDSAPCHVLLNRPSDVFSDPARIPSHIGTTTMRHSTYRWATTNYYPFVPAELREKQSVSIGGWPLPVGVKSVQADAEQPLPMYWPLPAPFPGDEMAALILSFTGQQATVDVFGLVQSVPSTTTAWGDFCSVWIAAPAQVRWCGASPYTAPGKELEPFVKAAVRWWGTVGMIAFPRRSGGRPLGTTKIPHDAEKLRAAFAQYAEQWEAADPTHDAQQIHQKDFAAFFDASDDGLQDALKDAGVSWHDLRRSYFGTD